MNTTSDNGHSKRLNDRTEEGVPPRRVVLRNALAVGCGLVLPAILIGCDSKKGESSTAATPVDSPNTVADPAASPPAAPAKVTQASVQYQAQPKGVQKCSECTHFIAESGSCVLVEGEISPNAWCLLWVQKA